MKQDQGELSCHGESTDVAFNSAGSRLSPDVHSDDSASKTLAEYFEAAADGGGLL